MSDNVTNLPHCQGKKADGSSCERVVSASQRYCYSHDPNRAIERSGNASRAAKSKVSIELREIKAQLKELAEDVIKGSIIPCKASNEGEALGPVFGENHTYPSVLPTEENVLYPSPSFTLRLSVSSIDYRYILRLHL